MNDLVDFTEGESYMVDLSSVEDQGGFAVIPKGRYNAQIESCDFQVSSNNNPMWAIVLEVSEGEHAGAKLFTYVTFSPKAMPMAKETLSRIAPALLETPFDPQDIEVTESLVGLYVGAQVDIKPYQGEQRNNVKGLYPAAAAEDQFV